MDSDATAGWKPDKTVTHFHFSALAHSLTVRSDLPASVGCVEHSKTQLANSHLSLQRTRLTAVTCGKMAENASKTLWRLDLLLAAQTDRN